MKAANWVLTSLLVVSSAVPALSGGPSPKKIKEISLERTPCFGACPIYKLTIKADGSVKYVGKRFVERAGTYTAHVGEGRIQLLLPIFDKAGFWKMKDKYTLP